MTKQKALYPILIEATEPYLGPVTERFLSRQISNHLDKEPAALTEEDVFKLTDWLKITFGHLTDDRKLVQDYAKALDHILIGLRRAPK